MEKRDALISVIVSVYNGEKYTQKCLDSVQEQITASWRYLEYLKTIE